MDHSGLVLARRPAACGAERAVSVMSARDDPAPGGRHPTEPEAAGGARWRPRRVWQTWPSAAVTAGGGRRPEPEWGSWRSWPPAAVTARGPMVRAGMAELAGEAVCGGDGQGATARAGMAELAGEAACGADGRGANGPSREGGAGAHGPSTLSGNAPAVLVRAEPPWRAWGASSSSRSGTVGRGHKAERYFICRRCGPQHPESGAISDEDRVSRQVVAPTERGGAGRRLSACPPLGASPMGR